MSHRMAALKLPHIVEWKCGVRNHRPAAGERWLHLLVLSTVGPVLAERVVSHGL